MRRARFLSSIPRFVALIVTLGLGRTLAETTPPPTIDIGPATMTVRYPDPLHLTAMLTNASPSARVSWTTHSGTASADFSKTSGLTTTANFSFPPFLPSSTYNIRATLRDGGTTVTDTMTVTVLRPEDATTNITWQSEAGDPVGEGIDRVFPGSTTPISGRAELNGDVRISYSSGLYASLYGSMSFSSGFGPLKPGVYENATSFSDPDKTRPHIEINRYGTNDPATTGRFEVLQVVYGEDGYVTAFHATFEQHFAGMTPALRGEVKFNIGTTEMPANLPPDLHISPLQQRVVHPESAVLHGLVADDGLPAPANLTTTWSKREGPGEVTFADEHAPDTTASFSIPGFYRLRLTATDGIHVSSFEVTVTVVDPNEQTSVRLESEPGDPIGGGKTIYRDLSDGNFAYTCYDTPVAIYYGNPEIVEAFNVTFAAPAYAPLRVGRYENVASSMPEPPLQAVLNFSGLGLGYGVPWTGWFEVKKISYGEGYNNLNALWVVFEVRANGASGVLRGEIKYHAESNVPTANRRPGVTAGVNQRVLLTDTIALHGYAEDDGLPGPSITTQWMKVTGPGNVNFADQFAADTTATFSAPGVYKLQLFANDGQASSTSNMVEIAVIDPAEETFLRIASEPGEPIGGGENKTFTLLDGELSPYVQWDRRTIGFNFNPLGNGERWEFSFSAPAELQQGTIYPGATFNSYSGYGRPTLWVSKSNTYTYAVGGSFAMRELVFDSDSRVASLWVTFTIRQLDGKNLTGEIRYRAHSAQAVDLPPAVDAGENQTIDRLSTAVLVGRVADDVALGDAVTVEWTRVSGPGEVVFTDPASPETTASFSHPGNYLLRLTANDGAQTSSADVMISKTTAESSLRLHVESPNGVKDDFYTRSNGHFTAEYSYYSGLSLQYTPSGLSTGWNYVSGSFLPPLGQELAVGLYSQVTPSGQRSDARGAVGFYNGPQQLIAPSDLTSSFEVKDFVRASNGAVTSCWVVFTIKAHDTVITGDWRYNINANALPVITLPTELHLFETTTHLAAQVTDDAYPGTRQLSYWWFAARAPSAVTFDSPNAAETDVHFGGPGSYTLRFDVSDGERLASAQVIVHVTAPRGTWSGLLGIPGGTTGSFRITLNGQGAFTGSLRVGTGTIPFSGTFGADDTATVALLIDGVPATLTLAPGPSGRLSAALIVGDAASTGEFSQAGPLVARSVPENLVGRYAMVFSPLESATSGPRGSSWGRAVLKHNGAVTLLVVLADGRRISGATTLASDSWLFAYLPVVKNRDWFAVDARLLPDETWTGRAHWMHGRTASLPAFDTDLDVLGSKAVVLSSRREPLTGRAGAMGAQVSIDLGSKTPLKLPLVIQPGGRISQIGDGRSFASFRIGKDGIFSGFMLHPATRRSVNFSGIVLGEFQAGYGFATHQGQSGGATLLPGR